MPLNVDAVEMPFKMDIFPTRFFDVGFILFYLFDLFFSSLTFFSLENVFQSEIIPLEDETYVKRRNWKMAARGIQ